MKRIDFITKCSLIASLMFVGTNVNGQNFEEWAKQERNAQQEFIENEKKSFEQFAKERDEAIKKMDAEFAEFLKQEWKNYQLQTEKYVPDTPKPDTKPIYTPNQTPPQQLKIEKVETIESCAEMPRLPFLAKSETDNTNLKNAQFKFYGNNVTIKYDPNINTNIGTINEQAISNVWSNLTKTNYSTTINDLLYYQNIFALNDWGFYQLVKQFSKQIANNSNGQTIATWFLLTKTNYKARIAFTNNNLFILVPSTNNIYGKPFFTFENRRYYMLDGTATNVFTYNQDFPESRIVMDLNIYKPMNITAQLNNKFKEFNYGGQQYKFNIKYDKNTIDFYTDYPQADIKIYFDATTSRQTKESLTSNLLPIIKDMDEVSATNFLLSFVQSFDYKTDEQQFGYEKFFFPDEMFHYQFSDCEDRAVLFAYLVKQLVGLDVIGLNYPGHMATAVCFNKHVDGSYIEYHNKQYIVCDPTYIGASIGNAMPQYAQSGAVVIENATQPSLTDRANKLWKIANKYGLYQGDNSKNIVFNNNGDAFMCGYFNGNINFLGQSLTSEKTDIFVARINADNTLGFLFKIGSKTDDIAYNIILDNEENIYFSGAFNDDLYAGGKTLKTQKGDMFIAKCSPYGQIEWINQANVDQLDNLNNTFVAQFDKNGKRLWNRTIAQSEDYTDYGISIDNGGNTFLTGSLLASTGLFNQSYKSIAHKSAFAIAGNATPDSNNNVTAPEIAGLIALIAQINQANNTQGAVAQSTYANQNHNISDTETEIYNQLGNMEFIRNNQGIVTIRTKNGKPAQFNTIKLNNNSKLKISIYNTGNAQIDFLSGSQYGNEQVWYSLNSIKVYKESGDITFDYDSNHTKKTINAKQFSYDSLN